MNHAMNSNLPMQITPMNIPALSVLSKTAILGCSRQAFKLNSGQLNDLANGQKEIIQTLQSIENNKNDGSARSLLRLAGTLVFCQASGQLPSLPLALPASLIEVSPSETSKIISNKAETIAFWQEFFSTASLRLKYQALQRLAQTQQSLPFDLLPQILKIGKSESSLRSVLTVSMSERARWLISKNKYWQWQSQTSEGELNSEAWIKGNKEQRKDYFKAFRQDNPKAARELFEQDLSKMNADERTNILKLLSIHLSMDDEAFLQNRLTDRSKEVQKVAMDLLIMLPESAFAQKMGERLSAFMKKTSAHIEPDATVVESVSLVKKLKNIFSVQNKKDEQNTNLNVPMIIEPPETFDKDWKEIEEKKPHYGYNHFGDRAWWLFQMISLTPLSYWQKHSGLSAKDWIDYALKSEWKEVLFSAWNKILMHYSESNHLSILKSQTEKERQFIEEWAKAVLDSNYYSAGKTYHYYTFDTWKSNLIELLPEEKQSFYFIDLFSKAQKGRHHWEQRNLIEKIINKLPIYHYIDSNTIYLNNSDQYIFDFLKKYVNEHWFSNIKQNHKKMYFQEGDHLLFDFASIFSNEQIKKWLESIENQKIKVDSDFEFVNKKIENQGLTVLDSNDAIKNQANSSEDNIIKEAKTLRNDLENARNLINNMIKTLSQVVELRERLDLILKINLGLTQKTFTS